MESMLPITESAHPNFAKTEANARSILFTLPIELRKEIYKHIAAQSGPIFPRQFADRSNKFIVLGNPRLGDRWRPHSRNRYICPDTINLGRLCRQIYFEVEDLGIFYKVNTFAFKHLEDLLEFLTAITPSRREKIRTIELDREYGTPFHNYPDHMLLTGTKLYNEHSSFPRYDWITYLPKHAAALLSRCTSLQYLRLTAPVPPPDAYNYVFPLDFFRLMVRHMQDDLISPVMWAPPIVEPIVGFSIASKVVHNRVARFEVNLLNGTISPPLDGLLGEEREVLKCLRDIGIKKKAERRSFTEEEVRQAIAIARVDIPGEQRAAERPISSRTRARLRAADNGITH